MFHVEHGFVLALDTFRKQVVVHDLILCGRTVGNREALSGVTEVLPLPSGAKEEPPCFTISWLVMQ